MMMMMMKIAFYEGFYMYCDINIMISCCSPGLLRARHFIKNFDKIRAN